MVGKSEEEKEQDSVRYGRDCVVPLNPSVPLCELWVFESCVFIIVSFRMVLSVELWVHKLVV